MTLFFFGRRLHTISSTRSAGCFDHAPGLEAGQWTAIAEGARMLESRQPWAVARISRHLWRMCFAFFIATGSFFLGQQDVLPEAVRGSPILFVLAFAPIALMLFWFVRVRFSTMISGLKLADAASGIPAEPRRHGASSAHGP
jgi:hypothetical protein